MWNNRLPNTPIQLKRNYTVEELLNWQGDRYEGDPQTKGFAANDAFTDLTPYKHASFAGLAKAISKIVKRSPTVLELGSGGGSLLAHLEAFGIKNFLAVEGNPLVTVHSKFIQQNTDRVQILNLQDEIDFGIQFDVILSFEVLEHISEDKISNFIKTIVNHMGPQSTFIGTASLAGHIDVHVTARDRNWWLSRFKEFGLQDIGNIRDYDLIAANHPFNWNSGNTSIFILGKARRWLL